MPYTPITADSLAAATNDRLRVYGAQIVRDMKYGAELVKHIRVITGTMPGDGQMVLPSHQLSELVQGFQSGFLPKGKNAFNAEVVNVNRMMVDHSFVAQDYYEEWVNHLEQLRAQGQNVNAENYPLTAYIIDALKEQVIDDEETKINVTGQFKARTVDKVQQAKYGTDGFYTVFKKLVKTSAIIPVVENTFAWTKSGVYDFVGEFTELLEERYQMRQMKVLCSQKLRRLYNGSIKDDYSLSIEERKKNDLRNEFPIYVEDSNLELVGNIGMAGKKIVIASPMSNMYKVVSQMMNPLTAKVPFKAVNVSGDWGHGFGFAFGKMVFAAGEIIEAPTIKAITPLTATAATIKIHEVPEATGYRLDIATDANFATLVKNNVAFASITPVSEDITISDGNTSYEFVVSSASQPGLTTATPYFARVRAELTVASGDNAGKKYTSANSATFTFTTP